MFKSVAEINCRHFNGYKPCGLSTECNRGCSHFSEVLHHVVIIHLGALGAVLRSTALLPAIRRKYSKAFVTWITQAPAHHLLVNNTSIDRVLTLNEVDHLHALHADAVLCIDKSLTAAGVAARIAKKKQLGFKANPVNGAILPASDAARELWEIGLSDQRKFFENEKTENQLVHEALELGPYLKDEYHYEFDETERKIAAQRRALWARWPSDTHRTEHRMQWRHPL